jgi:TRAP-type C4-dicarboxylate transport system substrate-binding protein
VVGATALVGLAGCAGTAGQSSDGAGAGDGVAYGATAEEYQEALADLEPVTLTYQPGAQSGQGHTGEAEQAFMDHVHELSGGKITLEPAWGQAIAPFDDVTEATADGRIDIGVEIPIYTPSKYAAINELINLAPSTPSSPYVTEIATTAAMMDVAWNTPEIVENYESMGVTFLRPVMFETSNALMCTDPVTSLDDFHGKQIRVGSASDLAIVEGLGASPVSMQFTETYEALQRNTIDCTLGGLRIGSEYGFLEVAPHVTFPDDAAWGRSPTAVVAGPGFTNLPLAAQQLIFDSYAQSNAGSLEASTAFVADAVAKLQDNGGDIVRLEADANDALQDAVDGLREKTLASDALDGEDAANRLDEAYEKWHGIAQQEGHEDSGDYIGFADGYADDPVDLTSFGERMFEEIYLPHRPE